MGWPTLPSLQYFLILFKRGGGGGGGVKPMFKKNFRIRNSVKNALVKAYGNGVKSANIFCQMFKRKGGGVKGVLNNVKKNCKIGKVGHS